MTEKQKKFIEDIAKYVCKYAPQYNILCPSAVIAQAILESGWGESKLASQYHNYFGMKCGTKWTGKSVNMQTQEEYTQGTYTTISDNFRVYDNMEDGVKGYFEFIQLARYQNLKGIKDPKKYLETIREDGYATSYSYVENTYKCVTTYDLTKYDSQSVSKKSITEIAQEVINGEWNTGDLRKQLLEASGYNYQEVQNKVNEILLGINETGGTNMTKTEKATQWMEQTAKDNSHGYDQIYRWGEKGDYDCSAAVITAWQLAGVPVKTNGATYTGNMLSVFKKCGFKDVTSSINLSTGSGLKRGDVLLNTSHHTAMYIGNGQEVEASINEKGTATGGQPGDQTGREFLIRSYRNYPWTNVLRYTGDETVTTQPAVQEEDYTVTVKTVSKGKTGASVKLCQRLLKSYGYKGADGKTLSIDGDAGQNTDYAIREYQKAKCLTVDGSCGPQTWKSLLGV